MPALGPIEPQDKGRSMKLQPLETEARAALPTPEAVVHLYCVQQTLRLWACREDGPLRPLRIHGRLAWPVSELRRVLGLTA